MLIFRKSCVLYESILLPAAANYGQIASEFLIKNFTVDLPEALRLTAFVSWEKENLPFLEAVNRLATYLALDAKELNAACERMTGVQASQDLLITKARSTTLLITRSQWVHNSGGTAAYQLVVARSKAGEFTFSSEP